MSLDCAHKTMEGRTRLAHNKLCANSHVSWKEGGWQSSKARSPTTQGLSHTTPYMLVRATLSFRGGTKLPPRLASDGHNTRGPAQ
jgi:hypothetical protein